VPNTSTSAFTLQSYPVRSRTFLCLCKIVEGVYSFGFLNLQHSKAMEGMRTTAASSYCESKNSLLLGASPLLLSHAVRKSQLWTLIEGWSS